MAKTSHVIGAALAGAAIGGAAVALSSKDTRKKLHAQYQSITKKGAKTVKELQSRAQDMTEKVQNMARDGQKMFTGEADKTRRRLESRGRHVARRVAS